jgi:hypothetical protein
VLRLPPGRAGESTYRHTDEEITWTAASSSGQPGAAFRYSSLAVGLRRRSWILGESYETAAGETITVDNVRLHRSVLYALYGDVPRVIMLPDRQFVFLTLRRAGPDAVFPEAGSFRLRLDDERYRGTTEVGDSIDIGLVACFYDFIRPPPSSDDERTTVAVEVPLRVTPERVAVEWVGDDTTARWVWPDARVRALRNPPRFQVEALDFPAIFACNESFDVAVRVANVGGRRDLFNAVLGPVELGPHQGWAWMSLPVTPGETATWEEDLRYPPDLSDLPCDERTGSVVFELDWGLDTRTVTLARREGTPA